MPDMHSHEGFFIIFLAQSIFIQFYGKCTQFVQLPESDFPMTPIYFQMCFFFPDSTTFATALFTVLSCKSSLVLLNPFAEDSGYIFGAERASMAVIKSPTLVILPFSGSAVIHTHST